MNKNKYAKCFMCDSSYDYHNTTKDYTFCENCEYKYGDIMNNYKKIKNIYNNTFYKYDTKVEERYNFWQNYVYIFINYFP